MERGKERGFLGLIIVLIIALILLKYFLDFDVFKAAASPQGQNTISYTHALFGTIWHYIAAPVTFVWNQIIWPIVQIIWKTFQSFIKWGQNPTAACCNATN